MTDTESQPALHSPTGSRRDDTAGLSIRTPDRRVRVFISSTIEELAAERAAAREAIQQLRQTPVFFESGARPHPPRALYQQMLEQSDVFVGIYCQSYGWVAPDKEISGIEDEYELSHGKPRLIYIKTPATNRASRLETLLRRIRDAGDVAYKRIESAEELRKLVADDLAVLLAERFGGTEGAPVSSGTPKLPRSVTPFVGRAQAVGQTVAVLTRDDVRMLTLVGTGGVGKTRLALEAGRRVEKDFSDGAVFVDLAPLSDAALVPAAILTALGARDEDDQSPELFLRLYLADKKILLVLDNFEHILGAAPVVANLLTNSPRLKILVTSRAPLRVDGEQEWTVEPMDLPDLRALPAVDELARNEAVALFVGRAQAIKPDFTLDETNAWAVAKISVWLDGLPLAIELAAARTRLFPEPAALLVRLQMRLPLLVGGRRDAPARQRTMWDAIGWSYDLLSEDEQALFRRLGVFVGGCTIEAAEVVAQAARPIGINVVFGLESLIEASLLRVLPGYDGEPRPSMLETVREFALDQLDARGETPAARRAHAEFFIILAEINSEEAIYGIQLRESLDILEADHDNLRTALVWTTAEGSHEQQLRLRVALWWFWYLRGFLTEGRRWLADILPLEIVGPPTQWVRLLLGAGSLAEAQGDYADARLLLEKDLTLATLLRDLRAEAALLNSLGILALHQTQHVQAEVLLRRSFARWLWIGDYRGMEHVLHNMGSLAAAQHRFPKAATLYYLSHKQACDRQDTHSISQTLNNLGEIAFFLGDLSQAERLLSQSLEMKIDLRDRPGVVATRNNLAKVYYIRGDLEQAEAQYKISLNQVRELGDRRAAAALLGNLGLVTQARGERQLAGDYFTECLQICERLDDLSGWCQALNQIAMLAHRDGNQDRAEQLLHTALGRAEEVEDRAAIAVSSTNLGVLAMSAGQTDEGLRRHRRSLLMHQEIGNQVGLATCLANIAEAFSALGKPNTTVGLVS